MFLTIIAALAQDATYASYQDFLDNLPPCTLVQVPNGTCDEDSSLCYEFEWEQPSGAFVPTTSYCPFGTMNVVTLRAVPGGFIPWASDIYVAHPDGTVRPTRAIVGDATAGKKYFVGRFQPGEKSVRLTGTWYASNGAPPVPNVLRGPTGMLVPRATQFNVNFVETGSCISTPVYAKPRLDEREGKISCQ
ncbi:hypothetical protein HYS28_03420 [Candidatus Uhrbacteria bacterium]|nr:hypothetical protein [Candidatus Uhrbacteria bacterium]